MDDGFLVHSRLDVEITGMRVAMARFISERADELKQRAKKAMEEEMASVNLDAMIRAQVSSAIQDAISREIRAAVCAALPLDDIRRRAQAAVLREMEEAMDPK